MLVAQSRDIRIGPRQATKPSFLGDRGRQLPGRRNFNAYNSSTIEFKLPPQQHHCPSTPLYDYRYLQIRYKLDAVASTVRSIGIPSFHFCWWHHVGIRCQRMLFPLSLKYVATTWDTDADTMALGATVVRPCVWSFLRSQSSEVFGQAGEAQ